MPDLLGPANRVPGYDSNTVNRNVPISPNDPQVQNVPDPSRVGRADNRTEQQNSGTQEGSGQVRYDSNFQTFLQRLREAPDLAQALTKLLGGREGTVVLSGMSEGIAQEMSQVLQMMKMDEGRLLRFLTGQFKAGSRFGGPLFALLRNAYGRASSDGVRSDILQFLKSYADYSSTKHIEGNIMRNLKGMADAMPASWGEKLRDMAARLQNGMAAGDRQGNLKLLQREVLPYMSRYVDQTHDMGTPRGLLTLLALDIARYENGAEENLIQAFHRLNGYGALKEQLGAVDDKALMNLLNNSEFVKASQGDQFTENLATAAAKALRGEGSAETQEIFKQLVNAILINESVYMPVNHFLIPMEWDGRMLFSELWVDPDDEEKSGGKKGGRENTGMKFLFKMDVQSLGLFDVVLTSRNREVDVRIACPERVAPFSENIANEISSILTRNGLTPVGVTVRKMDRPVTLTEVFPKIFEGMNSVNVKV